MFSVVNCAYSCNYFCIISVHFQPVDRHGSEAGFETDYYNYLFKLQMGFYPVAVYYNKTQHTNNTHHSTNTAHKTTQTIKDTLHTIYLNIYTYKIHISSRNKLCVAIVQRNHL
jgi:hypothetical protein